MSAIPTEERCFVLHGVEENTYYLTADQICFLFGISLVKWSVEVYTQIMMIYKITIGFGADFIKKEYNHE